MPKIDPPRTGAQATEVRAEPTASSPDTLVSGRTLSVAFDTADTLASAAANRAAAQGDRRPALLPGTVVANRYKIGAPLGQGGFGTVFHALDRLSGRTVAVKLLHRLGQRSYTLFRREIGLLRMLRLPGVVRFIDDGAHDERPFLVTEPVPGRPFPGVAQTWDDLEETVIALAEALDRVHAHGVVHRDLKPSNVLVTDDGHPVILDFGVSLAPEIGTERRDGDAAGTPTYMSPEQMRSEPATVQSDLYGLGVMLYEALHGGPAFVPDKFASLRARKERPLPLPANVLNAPPQVVRLVMSLCAPLPLDRPWSAFEVAQTLSKIRQSRQLRSPTRTLPTGDTPVSRDVLAAMFHGPEIAFHLPSDAAAVLHERTEGRPDAVRAEVDAWVRAGLCFWRDERLQISRESIDRLGSGLEVVRAVRRDAQATRRNTDELPSVSVDLAAEAALDAAAVQGETAHMKGGETMILPSVVTAVSSGLMPFVEDERVTQLVEQARVARREGRHGVAHGHAEGALVFARARGTVLGERQALVELAKLAIERQSVEAIDTALYEVGRAMPASGTTRRLEELLRAARLVRFGDGVARSLEAARSVPEFDDLELERLRRGQLLLAVGRAELEEHARVIDETLAWARATGDAQLSAVVGGWAGLLAYRRGDFAGCAEANRVAAEHGDTPIARLSALSNAAMAWLEAGRYDAVLEAGPRGVREAATLRAALFELRFRRLVADARYRSGAACALDEELLEAAKSLDFPSEVGPLVLTQAAIAWRLEEMERARALAMWAIESFGGANVPLGAALAGALFVAAGGAPSAESVQGWLSESASAPEAIRYQLHALLAAGGRAECVLPAPRWDAGDDRAFEILRADECVAFLREVG